MGNAFVENLNKYWFRACVVGVIFGAIGVGAALLLPIQYRADVDILLIARSRVGSDPYTTVKSAERVAENLAEVIGSSDFFSKVKAQTGYDLDWSRYDNRSALERRRLWQKTVTAQVLYGTGVLRVSAYSNPINEAEKMAAAIADAMVNRGGEYTSGDVGMKIINEPVASKFPARPNLVAFFVLGFVLGFLVVIFWTKKKNNISKDSYYA